MIYKKYTILVTLPWSVNTTRVFVLLTQEVLPTWRTRPPRPQGDASRPQPILVNIGLSWAVVGFQNNFLKLLRNFLKHFSTINFAQAFCNSTEIF